MRYRDPFDKFLNKCTQACHKKGVPKKGDIVYIEGDDDITGGRATVTKVFHRDSDDHFISISVKSNIHQIAWEGWLEPEQKELKKEYGKKKAKTIEYIEEE